MRGVWATDGTRPRGPDRPTDRPDNEKTRASKTQTRNNNNEQYKAGGFKIQLKEAETIEYQRVTERQQGARAHAILKGSNSAEARIHHRPGRESHGRYDTFPPRKFWF